MNFRHILVSSIIIVAALSCSDASLDSQPKITITKGVPALATTVHWIDSSLDLGKIPMGDSVVFYFRFTNTGTTLLVLGSIYTGCSCTTVSHEGTAVAPGMTDSIKAIFDTRKSVTGFVSKTIQVKGNMAGGGKVLHYRAMITGHKAVTGL